MELVTDRTGNDSIQAFCRSVISCHAAQWPPEGQVLAQEFLEWFGSNSLLKRDELKDLCRSKGVSLSFTALPKELRGVNCSFQDKREIVIAEREMVPGADQHTLFHEFREMLEREFVQLGYPIVGPQDSLEAQAELFAIACRMNGVIREFPAYLEVVARVEKKWLRYLGYAFVVLFTAACFLSCSYMRQMEEIGYQG